MSVVPMARLRGLVLDRDLPAVLAGLADLGEAEVLAPQTLPEWEEAKLRPLESGDLLPRVSTLAKRAGDLAAALRVAPAADGELRLLSDAAALDAAEKELSQAEAALRSVEQREAALRSAAANLRSAQRALRSLKDLPVDVARLRSLRYVEIVYVRVSPEGLARLRQAVEGRPVLLLPLGGLVDRRPVALMAWPRSEASVVESALAAVFAERVALPEGAAGIPAEALKQLDDEEAVLDLEARKLSLEREEIAVRHRRRLSGLAWQLRATRRVADLERLAACSGRARLFSAWIPQEHVEQAASIVSRHTRGAAVVEVESVRPGENGHGHGEAEGHKGPKQPPVPTRLRNHWLLQPFEALVNMYGRPAYGEADPTPIVAVSFVTMFGMMFGDFGQGGILLLLGMLARWRIAALRTESIIVMLCGGSSMVFGLLYGDAFGLDLTHHPIWLKPMEDTMAFLVHTAVFGVAFMTLGLAVNIANTVRNRDWGELLFGKNGAAGIWFYWGTLLAFVIIGIEVSAAAVILLWIVPMLLMFFREPLWHALQRRKRLLEGSPGEFLVSAFFELFETVIGYLSNTISFVRLAAFALNHAGLFTVVYLLAGMIGPGHMAGVLKGLVIVIGNIFIIGLEGLVVTIQSLRLEYYEFFSKFFRGTGVPFRPVSLNEEA